MSAACGGLDRGHVTVGRLIGAGAGADVEDGAGIAEGSFDAGRDPGIGLAYLAVAASQSVIGGAGQSLGSTTTGQLTLLAMKQRSWARR